MARRYSDDLSKRRANSGNKVKPWALWTKLSRSGRGCAAECGRSATGTHIADHRRRTGLLPGRGASRSVNMSNFRRVACLIVGISTVSAAQPSVALQADTAFQNLDALDALIASSLGAPAGSPGGAAYPLDRRLRLERCAQPISVAPARQGATVVSCGQNSWRIRVAVLGAAVPATRQATRHAAEPVTERARSQVTGAPGTMAGDDPSAIMVMRGDQVRASIVGPGFSVSTTAIAEDSGAIGERIRIRIDGRPRSTYAVVTSAGNVQL